jgi:hypothetical protein
MNRVCANCYHAARYTTTHSDQTVYECRASTPSIDRSGVARWPRLEAPASQWCSHWTGPEPEPNLTTS